MSPLEDLQKRKQRAIKSAQVADIYERYVFDLLKPEQDAVDGLKRKMAELDAQMQTNKASRQRIQEMVDRHLNEGNQGEAARNQCEIIDLCLEFWSLMADWLELSQVKTATKEKRKGLEWERSQVVQAYWANINYAKALEEEGSLMGPNS